MTSPGAAGSRMSLVSSMAGPVGVCSEEFVGNVPVPSAMAHDNYEPHAAAAAGCSDSSSDTPSPSAKASDRASRIIAEKQRRSEYNTLIAQMMSFLSDVTHSQRKVDKTSVLRIGANKIRDDHVFGYTVTCPHLDRWSNGVLKLFDLLGGFMISVTCLGRILNISPNVQEILGYCHIDLLGQNIYNYIHPEDKDVLRKHIYPPELKINCEKRTYEQQHHDFHIRIMRAGAKSDPPRYETCRIDGHLRRADKATASSVKDEQIIKRQRFRNHRTFPSSGNDIVFIGMAHVVSNSLPARMLPPTAYSEYWTRHLIDGRIVQCDQSISLVAGYMTDEVTGASAFVFMHKDDVRWVICVLRQMYDQSREFGESYYRLMSRSGDFIYMRTRGFLEIDRDTKNVQSFVCINSVLNEEYGRKMMEEMKRKYSVIVQIEEQPSEKVVFDEAPVEHPKRLERIVMHLVEPSTSENKEELKLVAPTKENIIIAIKNSEKVVQETGIRFDSRKRKITNSVYDDENDNLKRYNRLRDKFKLDLS